MKKLILISSLSVLCLAAQKPTVLTPASTGVSASFKSYAAANPAVPAEDGAEVESPNQHYIPRGTATRTPSSSYTAPASTMKTQTTSGTLPVTVLQNIVGLGNGFNSWTNQGLLPPDTTMAVGNGQIVQWVNLRMTVLNKTNGGLVLGGSGYVNGNQVWSGLAPTAICRTQNNGDPVVQYDRLANRWVLSQFAFNSTNTQNALCFAISQTNDATGAYNLYEYDFPNVLPDYPKLGVWTDAYYMTANNFTYPGGSYSGSQVCAFDRTNMLAGSTASAVCFTFGSNTDGSHFAMLPVDFEGSIPPPANSAAYILNGDWFNLNNPPYSLKIRRFKPDFVTPVNSTITDGQGGATDSAITLPFDNSVIGACNDSGGACVQQPSTTRKLDTLSMRPMYRLAYRNLGGTGTNRESLVFTQSIGKSANTAFAGIQLLEIRNPGSATPSIFNNVHFNPDANSRWMGAAASDKLGNIGMGYSIGSSTLSPGIRIAGRTRGDLPSTIRGELSVKVGSGNQTSTAQRWGDYSTMQIDPDDDCTFWFTTEYTNNTSSANWGTQIVSFRFNSCQ